MNVFDCVCMFGMWVKHTFALKRDDETSNYKND